MNGQKADTISIISPANKSHCCQTNLPRSYRRSIPFVAFICRAPIRARIFDVNTNARPSKKKEKKEKNLLPFDHWPYINHETTVLKFFLCTSFRYLSTLNRNRNRRTRMRMYKISTFKNFTKLNFKIQNRNIKHIIEFLKINFHDLYIYICICMNAASKGNFKGKKILRISLLLPTSWSQASSATVTYHPSHIAFLSVHFSFGKRENIPWRRRNLRRESLSIGESREIGDPAQNQSGNWFATIVEGAGLFTRLPDPSCAPSLPSPSRFYPLSSAAFHRRRRRRRRRRPVAINFPARMRLCVQTRVVPPVSPRIGIVWKIANRQGDDLKTGSGCRISIIVIPEKIKKKEKRNCSLITFQDHAWGGKRLVNFYGI